MEAPPVQYVRTRDGLDLAYMTSGGGRPLVLMPQPMSHIQLYWSEDTWVRPWLVGLSQRFRLVQYDGRGQGLSTRNLPESLDSRDLVEDLSAVVDRLELERFVLVAVQSFGHIAVHYTVEHPDRVEALILISSMVSLADWPLTKLAPLAEADWDGFLRMLAGLSRASDIGASVQRQKETITQADWLLFKRLAASSNLSGDLPRLRIPTLVLHPRESLNTPPDEARKLAAAIPNARMVLIDGATPMGDTVQGLKAIDDFLATVRHPVESPFSGASNEEHRGRLSPRESEVLGLIASGLSNQQIADELVLSLRTVERHITNLYAKIGARGKADATAYALRHGIG